MKRTIIINGIDCTRFFTEAGCTVAPRKVQGGNQGYMKDGSFQDDIICWKTDLTLTAMPLAESDLKTLIDAFLADDYCVSIYYFDPYAGRYTTKQFILSNPTPPMLKGTGPNGINYWTGLGFHLEEM